MTEQTIKRRMALAFVLICVFSGIMHMFLMHKKALRTQRYEAVYPDSQPTQAAAGHAQGIVSSLSAERFNLQVGNRRLTFNLAEGVKAPRVGTLVEVRFENDKALEIKPLDKL